ncbi:MAG: hypothetical protein EAX90_06880 [Candidatus Heimdallarchaeota archaeon]|nr:hypothetical protein [Candidatus Heimdallarchaeota archaeon]
MGVITATLYCRGKLELRKVIQFLAVIVLISCIAQATEMVSQKVPTIISESTQTFNDFSDFIKTQDNEYVESENYFSSINISYHGSESKSSSLEVFKLSAPDKQNYSDFWLQTTVEYQYMNDYDTGAFGCCIGPNRDEPIEISVNSDTIVLSDDSESGYAKYEVIAFPNGKKDSSLADASSMKLNGTVIFYAQRISNNLTLMVKDNTSKILVAKTWIDGVDYDRNSVAFVFQVGGISDFKISTYGITGEFTLLEDENTTTSTTPYIPTFNFGFKSSIVLLPVSVIILLLRKKNQRKR